MMILSRCNTHVYGILVCNWENIIPICVPLPVCLFTLNDFSIFDVGQSLTSGSDGSSPSPSSRHSQQRGGSSLGRPVTAAVPFNMWQSPLASGVWS
eukprot:13972736-Ditylum_brightwellii.AAC.1